MGEVYCYGTCPLQDRSDSETMWDIWEGKQDTGYHISETKKIIPEEERACINLGTELVATRQAREPIVRERIMTDAASSITYDSFSSSVSFSMHFIFPPVKPHIILPAVVPKS